VHETIQSHPSETETLPTLSAGEVRVATIAVLAARKAQLRNLAGNAFNDAFTVEALRAGGHENPEEVANSLSEYVDWPAVHQAAMRVNGLKTTKPGEGAAAPDPAPAAA
jgi:hypothetical protein